MWTPQSITELATGYWGAAALNAAVELGVFEALEDGVATADDLARRLKVAPTHIHELLEALAAMGLLDRQEAGYSIESSATLYLAPGSPSSMIAALRYNGQLYPIWSRLADCVRSGAPVVPVGDHLGEDPERTRLFVMGMHSRALALAPAVLSAINPTDHSRLLDLACGPGTFSRQMCHIHADLRVTQADLPPVLEIAQGLADESAIVDRIEFRPTDYRHDELPGGFDAVFFCGALHQEDAASAADVCSRACSALDPGGRLYVVDMMRNDEGPPFSALFSLNMLLTSPGGRVHSTDEVKHYLSTAGLEQIESRPIPESPYHLVTGRKGAMPG